MSISQLTRSDSGQYHCGMGQRHKTFGVSVSDGERRLKHVFMSAGLLCWISVFVLLTDPTVATPHSTGPALPPSAPSGSTRTPEQSFTSESEQQTRTRAATGGSMEVYRGGGGDIFTIVILSVHSTPS